VDIATRAALITATMDLKLVQSLVGAMRAVDGNPFCHGPLERMAARAEARLRLHPTPRIEPRVVYHPQPRFEPRFTVHPQPRLAEQPPTAPVEPEQPCRLHSPIQPPWKVRVWEIPVQPAPKIKVVIHRTDVIHKGTLIDLFI
jgi:hypothetical protein